MSYVLGPVSMFLGGSNGRYRLIIVRLVCKKWQLACKFVERGELRIWKIKILHTLLELLHHLEALSFARKSVLAF